MPRFALEDGESEIHHELARWLRDSGSRSVALHLTDRRILCVTRRDASGFWATLAAHVSADRQILEIRREDFERLEVVGVRAFHSDFEIVFHARAAPPLRLEVKSADAWERRIARWLRGDDLVPTVALPRAELRKPPR